MPLLPWVSIWQVKSPSKWEHIIRASNFYYVGGESQVRHGGVNQNNLSWHGETSLFLTLKYACKLSRCIAFSGNYGNWLI